MKRIVNQKLKCCHHLLTLVLFQNCMAFFLSRTHKRWMNGWREGEREGWMDRQSGVALDHTDFHIMNTNS